MISTADFLSSLWANDYVIPVAVALAVVAATVAVYYRRRKPEAKPTQPSTECSAPKNETPFPNIGPSPEGDVWAERQRRGIAPASTSKKENASEEKPFGSSYYYAHNSTKSKGGYSCGLKMEDFTMNGPRLLSKNGMPAEREQKLDEEVVATVPEKAIEAAEPAAVTQSSPPPKRSLPITRYLWDDPGDASGIATIRIENLPGSTSKEDLCWKDAKIKNVSASLVGEGLLVLATDEDEKEYRLHIPKLYDRATEVRTVVKAKRLLVKIKKKRNGINLMGKSNLEPWPQPQKISYNL